MQSAKVCDNCNKVFKGDGYSGVCSKECHHKAVYIEVRGLKPMVKRPLYTLTCQCCQKDFLCNRSTRKFCEYGCAYLGKKAPDKKDSIQKANERWLADKKPFNGKRKTYAQLNRDAEWKRVYDDNTWGPIYRATRG